MRERPILFSGEMVRAILEGRKTMTRRVIKWDRIPSGYYLADADSHLAQNPCPYGQPGDRLWVRETWCRTGAGVTIYRAENKTDQPYWNLLKWKPSIHMPRLASRITIEITGVRVEQAQDISEEDARAEGIKDGGCLNCGNPEPCDCSNPMPDARDAFVYLWNSINAKRGYGWESNPWVWVISFKMISPEY